MKVDAEKAAQLERDERAIRIAEQLARQLGRTVEVFDAEGNKFWTASPEPEQKLEN
jgi:hypothetical protein